MDIMDNRLHWVIIKVGDHGPIMVEEVRWWLARVFRKGIGQTGALLYLSLLQGG